MAMQQASAGAFKPQVKAAGTTGGCEEGGPCAPAAAAAAPRAQPRLVDQARGGGFGVSLGHEATDYSSLLTSLRQPRSCREAAASLIGALSSAAAADADRVAITTVAPSATAATTVEAAAAAVAPTTATTVAAGYEACCASEQLPLPSKDHRLTQPTERALASHGAGGVVHAEAAMEAAAAASAPAGAAGEESLGQWRLWEALADIAVTGGPTASSDVQTAALEVLSFAAGLQSGAPRILTAHRPEGAGMTGSGARLTARAHVRACDEEGSGDGTGDAGGAAVAQLPPGTAAAADSTLATAVKDGDKGSGCAGGGQGIGGSSGGNGGRRCGCLVCAAARGAFGADPWVANLQPQALAALATVLHALITTPTSNAATPSDCVAMTTPPSPLGAASGTVRRATEPGLIREAAAAAAAGRISAAWPGSTEAPAAAGPAASRAGVSVWVEATGGRPLLTLLRLYSLATRGHRSRASSSSSPPKDGPTDGYQAANRHGAPDGGAAGAGDIPKSAAAEGGARGDRGAAAVAETLAAAASPPPCCLAAKHLMSAVAGVCTLAPAAVRRELAAAAVTAAGAGDEDGCQRLVRGLVVEIRALLEQCPRCLLPRLGSDGRVASYAADGVTAADPCCPPAVLTASSTRSSRPTQQQPQLPLQQVHQQHRSHQQQQQRQLADPSLPLVCVAIRALAALCACSRRAARLAYAAGALDWLEALGRRVTRGSALEAEAERLYVALAARCQAAMDDICTGTDVRGLASLMAAAGAAGSGTTAAGGRSAGEFTASAIPPATSAAATTTSGCGSGGGGSSASGSGAEPSASAPTDAKAACPEPSLAASPPPPPLLERLPMATRVRAADRLCALVDSCSPDDFALLCRRGADSSNGLYTASSATISGITSSRSTGIIVDSATQEERVAAPLAVALRWLQDGVRLAAARRGRDDALLGAAAGAPREGDQSAGDRDRNGTGVDITTGAATGAPPSPAALTAAARLLLSCLDRARRTRWLTVTTTPINKNNNNATAPRRTGAGGATAAARAGGSSGAHTVGSSGGSSGRGGSGGSGGSATASTIVRCGPALRNSVWDQLPASGPWSLGELEGLARAVERSGGVIAAPTAAAGGGGGGGGAAADASPLPPAGPQSVAPLSASKQLPSWAQVGGRKGGNAGPGGGGVSIAAGGGDAEDESGYDEDGVRTVWNSGPRREVAAARAAWADKPLRDRVSWSQTSSDVYVTFQVPSGTRACDVSVAITAAHLTVRLGWAGRVLDGPLHRPVAAGDCTWTLDGDSLQVLLSKADRGHYWRALFEGGEEKGLYQVLQEAVEADEPVVPLDCMDEGGRLLLEELLERQALIADGSFDLERSFDDFRLVVGDGTL